MPHDVDEPADHELAASPSSLVPAGGPGPAFVPMVDPAEGTAEAPGEFTPDPESPLRLPELPEALRPGWPGHFHFCRVNLRQGCYRITYQPKASFFTYYGTMRVDNEGGTTISGDLYRYFHFPFPFPFPPVSQASKAISDLPPGIGTSLNKAPVASFFPFPYGIPIYPRNRYYSYLKVTKWNGRDSSRWAVPAEADRPGVPVHPTAGGSFDGTFPAAPGTRTVTIVLEQKPAPLGFTSSYFEGKLYEVASTRARSPWVGSPRSSGGRRSRSTC